MYLSIIISYQIRRTGPPPESLSLSPRFRHPLAKTILLGTLHPLPNQGIPSNQSKAPIAFPPPSPKSVAVTALTRFPS